MYTSACFGQEKIISGRVTNVRNQPMNSVKVVSYPSKMRDLTDTYGNYSLHTSLGETIKLNIDGKFEKFWVNDIGYNSYTIGKDSIININWQYFRYNDLVPNNDSDEPYTLQINTYKVTQQDLDSTYTAVINDSLVKRAVANNFKDITVFFGEHYTDERLVSMFYSKEISGKVKKELLLHFINSNLANTNEFPLGQLMRGNDRIMVSGTSNRIGNRRIKNIVDKPGAINTALRKQLGVKFTSCLYYINKRKYIIKDKKDAERVIRKISKMKSISIATMPAVDNYYGADGVMGVVFVSRSKN